MDCSLSGSSVHGIFQARLLEWVAISFSRGSSWPRIEPGSPALQADALPSEPPGEQKHVVHANPKMCPKLTCFHASAHTFATSWNFLPMISTCLKSYVTFKATSFRKSSLLSTTKCIALFRTSPGVCLDTFCPIEGYKVVWQSLQWTLRSQKAEAGRSNSFLSPWFCA